MANRVTNSSMPQQGTTNTGIAHEKIAKRAYEKWCNRGRPQGTDQQDWMEAEAELRAEAARMGSGSSPMSSQPGMPTQRTPTTSTVRR